MLMFVLVLTVTQELVPAPVNAAEMVDTNVGVVIVVID